MLRRLIPVILLLSVVTCVAAQPPRNYTFTHYSTANGLPSNQINAVVQDETGYIWIATADGLVRYDGIRYRTFLHNSDEPASLPANGIWQVFIDKKKNLWVLTLSGKLGIFNTRNFTFHPYAVYAHTPPDLTPPIKRLLQDETGNMYLLLNNKELLTMNEAKQAFSADYNFFPSGEDWTINDFAQQPGTQKYWIGVQDIGLVIFNRATGHMNYAGHNPDKEPAIEQYSKQMGVSNFLFDKKGRFWFTSMEANIPYVYSYDLVQQKPLVERYGFMSVFKSYHEINEIFEQRDGTIWLRGFRVFGHFVESEKKFDLIPAGYSNERSIDYRLLTCLYEDRENNIWVGTGINGVFRFNPSQEFFTNVNYISRLSGTNGDGNVLCCMRDPDGSLLIGTWRDGLYRYNQQLKPIPLNIRGIDEKSLVSIWCMYPSRDSNIFWMGTQPGIFRYDRKRHFAEHLNPPALENRTVRQLVEDKNGCLWLGMQTAGVFKWDPAKGKRQFDSGLSRIEAIAPSRINHMLVDSKGLIWISTFTGGVYVVNPDNDQVVMHFHDKATGQQRLMEEGVTAVLEYNDSLMVITTFTRILLYNRVLNKTSFLGTQETISGFIASLQKDNNGNLWVATSSALYRANIKSKVFIRFNRDDGIINDYFAHTSSTRLPDGRLVFGSTGQFIVFNPSAVSISTAFPSINITDFRVMNNSLPVDSILHLPQVELGYEDNTLAIDFSTLAYVSAHVIQYRMENIDKDWKTADKNNEAIYSYLPPGKYELQFRTIDSEGEIHSSELRLAIQVTPPFWRTWWFYCLLALLTGGLLLWLDKARMRRQQKMQKMRSSIAGNLHEEINTALNNINILSEMAKMKADSEPHKSKEFIEQIHSRSHNMIIAMDDMLWSISPDNDNMEKTVSRMQEYIDSLNNRSGGDTKMLVDDNVKRLNQDMQFRHEAFVLFKETISNLITSCASGCHIHLSLDKGFLLYSIVFNSGNCDRQQLNSLTDKLEHSRHAQAINARLQLQAGTRNCMLVLKMPVA